MMNLGQYLERRSQRKAEETAHRREMELKHGWRPSFWGDDRRPESVSTSNHLTLAGAGFAVGMFFVAVAVVVVGVAFAVPNGSPQEWVEAYLRLQEAVATRDLTASR